MDKLFEDGVGLITNPWFWLLVLGGTLLLKSLPPGSCGPGNP